MKNQSRRSPSSPEEAELYNTSLAVELAREKLEDGTASDRIICHYLTLATLKERNAAKKLEADAKLAESRVREIEQNASTAALYQKVIEAFGIYSGQTDEDDYEY